MMDLIQQKLPPNWKIVESSTKPLTSVGDNYGSSINSLTVSLENETTNEEKTLQLIAKMCPTDPGLCQAFQVDKTFVKEAAMYTDVAPLLRAYQVEKGLPGDQLIDSFIECFGARQSLDPTKDTVDSEAVLLLENLNYKGFRVGERSKGFNLKDTEFILRHLAQFHAVLIAFQRDRPESFKDKVLPYLNKLDLVAGMDQQILKRMREVRSRRHLWVKYILNLRSLIIIYLFTGDVLQSAIHSRNSSSGGDNQEASGNLPGEGLKYRSL